MAIAKTDRVFGSQNGSNTSSNGFVKDPNWVPANFYMNIGQTVEFMNETDGEIQSKFISLPQGLGLDNMVRRDVTKGTDWYRAEMDAKNALLDDILEICQTMKPGEDKIITLEIQLHRIKEATPVVKPTENPFRKKLAIVA